MKTARAATKKTGNAKYRVLSIDGGGLRGLIAARLLARLNSADDVCNLLLKKSVLICG